MSTYFTNPSNKKYSPNDYIWPVFSIRQHIQRADGWFVYVGDKRQRNRNRNRLLNKLEK